MKKKLTRSYYFIILKKGFLKKAFQKSNFKCSGLPKRHILGCVISFPPPPESQLAFHIYYVKYKNTLTCKRISWDSGGGVMFDKYFSISYMFNAKSDQLSPKIKRCIYGNRKSNAKS